MKLVKFATIAFIPVIALCGIIATAQDEDSLRAETELVSLNISVVDDKGQFVKDLKKEQFEVFDNGRKQAVEFFSAASEPVSYGVVYDLHPTTSERTAAVLDALRAFTKELPPADDFFTVVFNERGNFKADFVPTVEQVERHLQNPARREPNSLYDAIYLAADKIRASRNLKRTLLVISDSADHYSHHSFAELKRHLRKMDVQIYALIWDESLQWAYSDLNRDGKRPKVFSKDATPLDRVALGELSMKSGGFLQSLGSENSRRLYELCRQIATEVGQQYTIGFYPESPDGKWHTLQIRLNSRDKNSKRFVLSYRQGYQSSVPKSK